MKELEAFMCTSSVGLATGERQSSLSSLCPYFCFSIWYVYILQKYAATAPLSLAITKCNSLGLSKLHFRDGRDPLGRSDEQNKSISKNTEVSPTERKQPHYRRSIVILQICDKTPLASCFQIVIFDLEQLQNN